MNMWRFLHYINKPSLVPIRLQLFKWGEFYILSPSYNLTSDDLWPWYMTFDRMNIQSVPYCINKPSLVPIRLTFQKRSLSQFHLTTWPDLRWPWPWYVTFDLINKWGFPCCIYDPTLVEIHQSMWKAESNVNLFLQQQTTTTVTKWSLCAGDTIKSLAQRCNMLALLVLGFQLMPQISFCPNHAASVFPPRQNSLSLQHICF